MLCFLFLSTIKRLVIFALEWRRSGWFNTRNRYALFREIIVYKRRRIHWFIDFNFRLSDSQWMTLDTHVICTYLYLNLVLSCSIIIFTDWIFYVIAIVSNCCRILNFRYYVLNSVMPLLASTKIISRYYLFSIAQILGDLSVLGTFVRRNNQFFLHCLHIRIVIIMLLNKSLLLCI